MLQRLSEFQARCHRTEWELDLTITCRLEFDQGEREARQRLNNYRGEIWSPGKHHVAHSAPPLWPSADGHSWSNIGPAAWMMGRNGIRMRRRRRRGMWTQTPRPAGMTFDSGSDLLLSYSDERLCLPSDNCSLRGRERSINQNELRYCRTTSTYGRLQACLTNLGADREASASKNLAGRDAVILRWQSPPPPDVCNLTCWAGADTGGRGEGSPLTAKWNSLSASSWSELHCAPMGLSHRSKEIQTGGRKKEGEQPAMTNWGNAVRVRVCDWSSQ